MAYAPELSAVDQAKVGFEPFLPLSLSLSWSTSSVIGFSSLNKSHSLDLAYRQFLRTLT